MCKVCQEELYSDYIRGAKCGADQTLPIVVELAL
jgi:hypothetical protein